MKEMMNKLSIHLMFVGFCIAVWAAFISYIFNCDWLIAIAGLGFVIIIMGAVSVK